MFIRNCTPWFFLCALSQAATLSIAPGSIHLRSGAEREWRSFPAESRGASIVLPFEGQTNTVEQTLIVRQRDVKNTGWIVSLNGTKLGALQDDERTILRLLPIPAGVLRSGENKLRIEGQAGRLSDDIELNAIRIEPVPMAEYLAQATVEVRVDPPQPTRITVVNGDGTLVPFSTPEAKTRLGVRTGVVYTTDGQVRLGVPAGDYIVYASRGFDYSAPSVRVTLSAGGRATARLPLRREVTLPDYISCDTHIHTLELSGHGDASVEERVLTAAGEGLDLMIPTEHNRTEDYRAAIGRLGLARWLVTLPGNEITTAIGHFNVFPLVPGGEFPNPKQADWTLLMQSLHGGDPRRVVIQNHPQDVHSDYRPFHPRHHLSSVGENLNGRPFGANAMEVVNSGAMFSDPLQLVRDWMGLLTRGLPVAAIGSSDTHTVDFVPIAQARTYIDVKGLDWRNKPHAAAERLAAGRNLVSYGLVAELSVVKGSPPEVMVTVQGPSWAVADTVRIFSNGTEVWQAKIADEGRPGVKFQQRVRLALPRQDTFLVAVATGPGALHPFWEVRKPYQPTSDEWTPLLLGVSGAHWLDLEGDRKTTSPLEHARQLVAASAEPLVLARALGAFDASVTQHALNLLRLQGHDLADLRGAFLAAARAVRQGYDRYIADVALATSQPR